MKAACPGGLLPPKFDEQRFLENLLLDEDRAAYAAMTPAQRTVVRHAFRFGQLGVTK